MSAGFFHIFSFWQRKKMRKKNKKKFQFGKRKIFIVQHRRQMCQWDKAIEELNSKNERVLMMKSEIPLIRKKKYPQAVGIEKNKKNLGEAFLQIFFFFIDLHSQTTNCSFQSRPRAGSGTRRTCQKKKKRWIYALPPQLVW
jgi:hypothetical protein